MDPVIAIVFLAGYFLIIFEHPIRINKAAFSLITGVFCWLFLISSRGANFRDRGFQPSELFIQPLMP